MGRAWHRGSCASAKPPALRSSRQSVFFCIQRRQPVPAAGCGRTPRPSAHDCLHARRTRLHDRTADRRAHGAVAAKDADDDWAGTGRTAGRQLRRRRAGRRRRRHDRGAGGEPEGLRTLLIERSGHIGGTTARSSGTVWIPDNPEQRRHGVQDDAAAARTYLDALVGTRADPALREAFIVAGPRMLQYLEERTDVRFRSYLTSVDYRQDLPGAARGGRPLEPLPFDGRTLGKAFDRVRRAAAGAHAASAA